jgi:RNA polymerase sigma-70 factor (ECF subfamily)
MSRRHGAACTEVATGDDERFAELYRESFDALVQLCRRCLNSHGDAEAVAQEAFIRAWLSWDRFAQDQPFWPWVATIARRLCINTALTQTRRETFTRENPEAFLPVPVAEDDLVVQSQTVRQALGDLSLRDRRLLLLREIEGWSYEEIANFDRVTVESVRGSLKRARVAFRLRYARLAKGVLGGIAGRSAGMLERWASVAVARFGTSEGLAIVAAALLLAGAPGTGVAHSTPSLPGAEATASGPPAPPPAPARATAPALVGPDGASSTVRALPARPTESKPGPAVSSAAGASPDDGWGYRFTPSPSYQDDRTVYASGRQRACDCPLLLVSRDGGASWSRLAAEGRDDGHIVLPPAYPRDPRIFSISKQWLSVSDDGGRSFRVLSPAHGPATMSPGFSAGDPRILFGTEDSHLVPVSTEYHDDDGRLHPSTLPLAPGVAAVSFAFSPDYGRDGAVLVPVVELRTDVLGGPAKSGVTSAMYRCDGAGCVRVIESSAGAVAPTPLWTSGPRGAAFSWTPFGLHRSRDGGRSFTALPLPAPGRMIQHLTASHDGRLFTAVNPGGLAGSQLYVSDDDGDSWRLLRADDSWLVTDLTVLPDGAVLAGRWLQAGGGLGCSLDGGRTWMPRCDRG